jgi:hypothetical protein
MSDKQKPHVDQLEEDDEFEEFDQVRFLQMAYSFSVVAVPKPAFKKWRIHVKNI